MIVYLDGQFVPAAEARVSVFDRGYLFGDGIYEGLRAASGSVVALRAHIERMRQGLAECRIGFDAEQLGPLSERLLERTKLDDAFLYWQVTRGVPRTISGNTSSLRSRIVESGEYRPTVLGFAGPLPALAAYVTPQERSASLVPDTRWSRGHIKSISLMGGVLAAYDAAETGGTEAILVRDGLVTEAVATNVFASIRGRIATPPLEGRSILAGVTRRLLLDADPTIEVRDITADELRLADEIMLAGTATMVVSITRLDGQPVGSGRPGPAGNRLLGTLVKAIERDIAATV